MQIVCSEYQLGNQGMRAPGHLTAGKTYCAVAFVEMNSTERNYLIEDDYGYASFYEASLFEETRATRAWPLDTSWRFRLHNDSSGRSWLLLGYPSLVNGGPPAIDAIIDGECTNVADFQRALTTERLRDEVVSLLFDWRDGMLNSLEVSTLALTMLDSNRYDSHNRLVTALANLSAIESDTSRYDDATKWISEV